MHSLLCSPACDPVPGSGFDLLSYVTNAEVCLPSTVNEKMGKVAGSRATFPIFIFQELVEKIPVKIDKENKL